MVQPHFVMIPFMAQGHLIPMTDISRMLAQRGVIVSIFTTPLNAMRINSVIGRAVEAGLRIRIIEIRFPSEEAGLPQGCECFDMLPSIDLSVKFFEASQMLESSVEQNLKELKPSPTCIISDMCFPWTTRLARKFSIPRIVFHGFCCFALLCTHLLRSSTIFDHVTSDSELVAIPGLPDKIELNKSQVMRFVSPGAYEIQEFQKQIMEATEEAYGVVVNSFQELEPNYVREYRKAIGLNVWCIGPVSLCNKENLDKAERGRNRASYGSYDRCLKWLDSWEKPNSVMYVCLGSLTRLATSQLIELGLGLELSNRPFIWVLRETSDEFKKWLVEEKYEERVEGKGFLIHEWAPQVLILSHPSIGGFLTHCGWNSTLEGICLGVPLLTWPVFAEQFINEELVVNILKTGIKVGVKKSVYFGHEEEVGVLVKREDVRMGIQELMDGELIRKRAKELSNLARTAMDEGGSSHANLTKLIQDVMEEANLENHSSSVDLIT